MLYCRVIVEVGLTTEASEPNGDATIYLLNALADHCPLRYVGSQQVDMDNQLDMTEAAPLQPDDAAPQNDSATQVPEPVTEAPSTTAEAIEDREKKPPYYKPRKLYQALARVQGLLKAKDGRLVLVTNGDKAELAVVQVTGKHTATRLLVLPANRRQGIYSLYPQIDEVVIFNFIAEADSVDPNVPPVDQMFVSGKFASREDDAFYVDIGRNKRTHRAKKQIELPLRITGEPASEAWKIGQWIGLVLHRQGTDWRWQGETRAVLKSRPPKQKQTEEGSSELP